MKFKRLLLFSLIVSFVAVSCSSDDDNIIPQSIDLSSSEISGSSFEAFKDTLRIESATEWTITGQDDADWVSYSPKKGKGKTDVIISVEKNNNPEARKAILTVATKNDKKEVVINQPGISAQEEIAGAWRLKHLDFSGKAVGGAIDFSGETKDDQLTDSDTIIFNKEGEFTSSVEKFAVTAHAVNQDINAEIKDFFEDGDWEIDADAETLTINGDEYKIMEDSDFDSELKLEMSKLPEDVKIELTDEDAPDVDLSDIIAGLEDVDGTIVLEREN